MIGSGKKEGWPERFQDLGNWCPLPQDELHTPKVNFQDEFNFSIDGHDWDVVSSPVDLQCDTWGIDTQFGISPCQPGIGEINNTIVQERTPQGVISNKTPNLLGSGGKLFYTVTTDGSRSPLKQKGNVLLSQGNVKSASEDSTYLSMAATVEHKTNNSVVISNNCFVLPIAMPEFDSAKLNSSSSTSFITPSQLQSTPSPTPPPPTKKFSTLRESTAFGALSLEPTIQSVYIKEEHHGIEDSFKVPTVCIDEGNEVEPTPVYKRDRPQLKLNIAAANNASKFSSTLNTPEVLRPLVDGDSKEFNLLHYVCNDGDFPGLSQDVDEESDKDDSNLGEHAIRDHDYTDPPWQSVDLKSDLVIKSEPGSPASTSCSILNSNTNKGSSRRKRSRDDSSDYNASEFDESLSEDDSQEWSPTPTKKRKKRKTSINSTKSSYKTGSGGRKSGGRRASTSLANSSTATTNAEGGGQDKYRALRERNNEASRRSRMNRKQRDVEMLNKADELYKKNVYLKARAEKMENLVKYMRAEIMKALTKPK